jgi:AcrR family transcriptional regulator
MSPRAYNLGRRRAATDETRSRIIEAARRLLAAPDGITAFTIDGVAREAGVARMTVYYQYGSKAALLEALYDDLATRGLVASLPAVFQAPSPQSGFLALIDAFNRFWAGDRVITRRLRALAALDPVIEAGIRTRDGWRRGHFTRALAGVSPAGMPEDVRDDLLETVLAMTSFETFDQLAEARGDAEAARLVCLSVEALLAETGRLAGDIGPSVPD